LVARLSEFQVMQRTPVPLPTSPLGEVSASRVALQRQVLLLGPDAAGSRLAAEMPAIGTRLAIIASASAADTGLLGLVKREALAATEIVAEIIGVGVGAPISGVAAISRQLADLRVDGLVALGGGSVIDTAKATALAVTVGGEPDDLLLMAPTSVEPEPPAIRVIAIPTTLSGAEATPNAGVIDGSGRKRVIRGRSLAPQIVVADPAVLRLSPPDLIANTAMMALAHCLESLYAPSPNPLSVATALHGAELIGRGFAGMHAGGLPDDAAFANLGAGGVMAGLAIAHARSGLQHALCHVLGSGRFGMSQAQAHAVMLPSVMRFNERATGASQQRLVAALGASATSEPAAYMEIFREAIGAAAALRAFALDWNDLAEVAAVAAREPGAIANPVEADVAEIRAVLEAAW
jgi:maleylacetate reductase